MANVPTINDPVSKIYTPSEFPVWKSDLLRNLEVTKNALHNWTGEVDVDDADAEPGSDHG